MYREPRASVMDRHTLIEFDGDFTDYEMGHLLRKAYENHKAPHEYDDIKKYIRDIVIGEHNSVFLEAGQPNTLATASVIMPSNTVNLPPSNSGVLFNNLADFNPCTIYIGGCNPLPDNNTTPVGNGIILITYNNGTAAGWMPIYTTTLWSSQTSCPSSGLLVISQSQYIIYPINYVAPNYLYAPYITSTNPLTLSTYYYWTYPSSSNATSYNYVIFSLLTNPGYNSFVFLFYSGGSFSFSPGTTYLTMWQWTYT